MPPSATDAISLSEAELTDEVYGDATSTLPGPTVRNSPGLAMDSPGRSPTIDGWTMPVPGSTRLVGLAMLTRWVWPKVVALTPAMLIVARPTRVSENI